MPIRFACPQCGQKLSVPEEKSGLAARCPKCRQPLVIPALRPEPVATAAAATTPAPVPALERPITPGKPTAPVKPITLAKPTAPVKPQSVTKSPRSATDPPVSTGATLNGAASIAGSPTSEHRVPLPSPHAPSPPPSAPPPALSADEADEMSWLYAESDSRPARVATSAPAGRQIASWVVVTQAILLVVMLATGFGLGIVSRRTAEPTSGGTSNQPVTLTGRITYGTSGGTQFPDDGAVVLAVPSSQRPAVDEKLAYEGLRPSDLPPDARHPALERLRVLGGAYARAEPNGEFRLALPRGGAYYVLIVSNHGTRRAQTVPNKSDLAQLGRYVTMANELIGDRRYRWRLEELTGPRRIEELLPY